MSKEKVCIYPCNGIGNVFSSVSRYAAYMVVEDYFPEKSTLLCLPALLRGVDEDIEMLEKTPTIVIEGCAQKCASNALRVLGIRPLSRVYIPDVVSESGIKPGKNRRELSEEGLELSKMVAEMVVEEINYMFEHPTYQYKEQFIIRPECDFFDPMVNVDKDLNYEEIRKGLSRSRKQGSCGSCCGSK